MTTPDRLAEALQDIAASYTSETPGLMPDPTLGRRLAVLAKRTRDRVNADDPRLTAFAPHTDPTGYPWLPESVHNYLADETNALWSFERWFTGLAQAAAEADAPDPGELAEMAADAAEMQKLRDAGMRLTESSHDGETATYLFRR